MAEEQEKDYSFLLEPIEDILTFDTLKCLYPETSEGTLKGRMMKAKKLSENLHYMGQIIALTKPSFLKPGGHGRTTLNIFEKFSAEHGILVGDIADERLVSYHRGENASPLILGRVETKSIIEDIIAKHTCDHDMQTTIGSDAIQLSIPSNSFKDKGISDAVLSKVFNDPKFQGAVIALATGFAVAMDKPSGGDG